MIAQLNVFFKLTENRTSFRQEIMAGLTTFLTMAYIIFVNPNILGDAGMDKGALITATILAAAFATILVGLWANVPFAMAPGMGLNAFFAYTLVLGQGMAWQTALGVVFISGIFFLVLTLLGVRKWIIAAIPMELRLGTAAGIGLFITFIGFKTLGLFVPHPATMVTLGTLTTPVALGLVGLALIAVFEVMKIRGSILVGIIVTTILGMIFGLVGVPDGFFSTPPSIAPIFMELDILSALKWGFAGAIFSFMFVDLFDSVGTVVACSYEADMVDKDGNIRSIDRVLEADAVATVAGALMGTSTTTTYIESGSGIAQGGRTGLTALSTGFFFLAALLFTPFIAVVPAFATAPALIVVGVFMFKNVQKIDFQNFEVALPAFLTIILMPLTFSISMGLCVGFLSFILVSSFSGNIRKIHPVMWIIGVFSMIELLLKAL
ncbi:AGZA family xanthine/uracil permease-like MFS transporter [Desulfobotulus alkaliphilus]|uniref:AGZA family xanthine/uracil permease-like MFS transporter n=1 Tax=Desulfobotulus alkaliphilus TaxID=622671 RepID=A0A562RZ25_9BACT|nr:NCS2 family permease [Desulfobotulus alkaliphilus]TWI74391.1 AGZA family xanthine/uracil permease-like MFS transporter [Desulfobotulus alkaliphilus]